MENVFYPEMIRHLPDADIPFAGVKGKLFQGNDHQMVFFEIEAIGEVAEHSHGAQWGVVFSGEMDFTIGGKTTTYKAGDRYFIPAGVPHSACFKQKTFLMDFFEDADRYGPKK
ncbi:MAG: cupin domain-containing protein [Bacteroidales bacterium]|nr:cupin domain-containing protein [Bacteroidales bacterium]